MNELTIVPDWLQELADDIQALHASAKFIAEAFANDVSGSVPLHSFYIKRFSQEPWRGVFEGYTVTFVSLQLAFALGYKRVLLVGVDHKFTYEGQPNAESVMEGNDPNHFHPDYFRGMRWNNPDLVQSRLAYIMAQNVYEHHGREIINLGPDSALDVFPKGKIEDWR